MKRNFALFISTFVIGLVTIIAMVSWKLTGFATTIKREKQETVAFYRASVEAGRAILNVTADVGKLFQVKDEDGMDATLAELDQAFDTVETTVQYLKQDRFATLLQTPLTDAASSNGQAPSPDHSSEIPDETSSTEDSAPQVTHATYGDLVTAIEAGFQEAKEAYADVQSLASSKLKLTLEIAPLKKQLSKILRKNLDLQPVDPKAFNNLARGAITVLYTDSNRDVKFAGDAKFTKGYEKLIKAKLDPKQKATLEELKAAFDQTYERARVLIASSSDSEFFTRKARDVVANITLLEQQVQLLLDASLGSLEESSRATTKTVTAIAACAALISISLGIFLAGRMIQRIGAVADRLRDISEGEGDLTQSVQIEGRDEIAALAQAFNTFVKQIHDTIVEVASVTSNVAAASTQIAASSDEMAQGMNTQNNQVMQISSAIEQMSASIVEVARKSNDAAANASDSGKVAQEGGQVVSETITDMQAISDAVNAGAASVSELGKRSQQIGQIIEVINDIADQTNLLALNAAIEAARAGEHGRGFAVVADEVRKLADRTTKATDEIADSIKAIQGETQQAVDRMQSGTQQVETGVQRAQRAGASLQQIVSSAQEVASLIQSIAAAAEQQSSASEQVARNVEAVSEVTQSATQGANQAASTAGQLSTQAEQLQRLVGKFKVNARAA